MNSRNIVARMLSALAVVAVVVTTLGLPGRASADGGLITAIAAAGGNLVPDAGPAVAQAAEPAAMYRLYLPSLRRAGTSPAPQPSPTPNPQPSPTPNPQPSPTPNPQPQPTSGAFFFTTEVKTLSSVAKVDAQGRMHVVLSTFVTYAENPKAIYGFCRSLSATECASGANWSFVGLEDMADGIELDLTSDGRPRVLIRKKNLNNLSTDYVYGECDTACDIATNWRGTAVVNIAENQLFAVDEPQRAFELDPQDRPRFVVGNGWGNGQPHGIFYLACDDNCTAGAGSWTKTPIYEGPPYRTLGINYPSLAFTTDGRPRVVGMMTLTSTDSGLLYLECDNSCDEQASWSSLDIDPQAAFAGWDIEVDRQNRLHVVLTGKVTLNPLPAGGQVEYRTCDENCTSASSWSRGALPLQGKYADLELDGQGRPRIAYNVLNATGVGFASCDANCLSGASWRGRLVDTASQMIRDFPVANSPSCEPTVWAQFTPSLALDPAGNPRIAFDALNVSRCWADDPTDGNPPASHVEKMFRAVRFVIASR